MSRRVVITSMGYITSMGDSEETVMDRFRTDQTGFRYDEAFSDVLVCPVDNFDVRQYTGRYKNRRYLNRGAAFCGASAILAVQNADIPDQQLADAGLFSGVGPNLDMGEVCRKMVTEENGQTILPALWMLSFLPNTASSVIADILGIHGENATISTACSASLQAMGEGFRRIKDGYLDMALAGGGDSRLNHGGILAYHKAQALHRGTGAPETAYSAFDKDRSGFVPGEGGAYFVLEDLAGAQKRNAPIVAEVCGFGCSLDGYNMTAPQPDGIWAEKAVRHALHEAGVAPADVDLVAAHGTGTVLNDHMEAEMIHRVFSRRPPLVTSFKSWVGHLAAACGAVETALALLCMKNSFIPRIRNLRHSCTAEIRLVRENTTAAIDLALIQSFGFGGQNSALVVRKWKN